jgi:hypothetical protein
MTNEEISAAELLAWKNRRERAVAYVGKKLGDGMGVERFGETSRHELTLWTGEKIGTCALGRSWRVPAYTGERMYQIYATVNGVNYTGRGCGQGMAVVLRPVARQNHDRKS